MRVEKHCNPWKNKRERRRDYAVSPVSRSDMHIQSGIWKLCEIVRALIGNNNKGEKLLLVVIVLLMLVPGHAVGIPWAADHRP